MVVLKKVMPVIKNLYADYKFFTFIVTKYIENK